MSQIDFSLKNPTIIVVGLSAASMAFITKLRTFDKDSKVLAFSAEKDFPYNRCFLADFLTGDSTVQEIELKPHDFFEKNNIQVFFDTRVDRIEPQNNVVFAQEKSYRYDYLFLGIGTRPLIPGPFKNIECQGIFTFHTLADMQNITNFIQEQNPKSAVVIGAGLNGVEAASSLIEKGLSVALVEGQETILPGQVDDQTASWIASYARYKGLTILQGCKAAGIYQNKGKSLEAVELATGTKIATEMLVLACGSVLNSELLELTGIELEKGSIRVNQNMQTNIPNILAGGDICVVPDMISKKLMRSTTWSDAMLQGLCAATTLSPAPRAYPGMVGLRDSYFFCKHFYACGDTTGNLGYIRTVCKQTEDELEIIFTQNEILKGFILVGDVSKVAQLKKTYTSQEKFLS
jgi:NAD(P)H-nitrite reductase large subunit